MAVLNVKNIQLIKFLDIVTGIDLKQQAILYSFENRFKTIGTHLDLVKELIKKSKEARKKYNKGKKESVQQFANKIKIEVIDKFIPFFDSSYEFSRKENKFVREQKKLTLEIEDVLKHDYMQIKQDLDKNPIVGLVFAKIEGIMDDLKENFEDERTEEEINQKIEATLESFEKISGAMRLLIEEEMNHLNTFFYEGGLDAKRNLELENAENNLQDSAKKIMELQRREKEEIIVVFEKLMKKKTNVDNKIKEHILNLAEEQRGFFGWIKSVIFRKKITVTDIKADIRSIATKPQEVQDYLMYVKTYWGLLDKKARKFLDRAYYVSAHRRKLEEGAEDYLTKLGTKKIFYRTLKGEIGRYKRSLNEKEKDPNAHIYYFSLIMIDIDYFKKFNDIYGHPVGDRVLGEVAGIIIRTIRRNIDLPFRYGGEEMAIVLPHTKKEGAATLAEKLRTIIKNESIERIMPKIREETQKQDIDRITISLGVAAVPEDALNEKNLIEMADKALYYSKKTGRDRVTSSWPGVEEEVKKIVIEEKRIAKIK